MKETQRTTSTSRFQTMKQRNINKENEHTKEHKTENLRYEKLQRWRYQLTIYWF
jgi:hypothetical protein